MSQVSFRQNHISPETYEIALVSRRFPPSLRLAVISVIVSVLLPTGSWLLTDVSPYDVALRALAIVALGVPVFYAAFYVRTGQVAGNALLANITYGRGYLQWGDLQWSPLSWKFLFDGKAQFAWADVTAAQLVPQPGPYAQHRLALALTLHDGRQLGLRVPNLRPSEEALLAETLDAIAARNGIRFSIGKRG